MLRGDGQRTVQLALDVVWARLPERWRSGRRRTVLVGASWSLAGQGGVQFLRLISTLVLARLLLSPEAFGLVALVNVFLTGLEMLSDVGLGPNIVQHARGEEPAFLRTAYTIQLLRSAALWLLAALLAYPFARFYEEPLLGPLVLVASLGTLIRGATNIGVCVLNRKIAVRPLALMSLGAESVGFMVAVTWAVVSPSAWALIAGAVANALCYTIVSQLAIKVRHRPGWDRAAGRDILKFGGWIVVATATWFLCSQGERLFLGKLVSPADLGCFAIAAGIASLPLRYVSQISGNVVYPLIASALRADRNRGLADYRRIRVLFAPMSVVTAAACVLLGKPFAHMFLGPNFANVGWMLQLLGLRAGFDIVTLPVSGLILASGRSSYSALQNTARLAVMVSGVYVAIVWYGVFGGVLVLALSPLLCYVVTLVAVRRLAPTLFRLELAVAVLAVFGVVCLGGFVWAS